MLPSLFQQQMRDILGGEYPAFEAAMQEPAPVSIRWNVQKTVAPAAPPAEAVPWHPQGRYLPERPVFTLDPRLHAGGYYVQEASSMFVYQALRQTLDLAAPLKILDLCAAPGGKSTLIAAMLGPDSLLVANEVIAPRVGILRENLERWGLPNIAVTSADAGVWAELEGWFDAVLVDAPCSGEGLFRKDPGAADEWSPGLVELCGSRQRRIAAEAVAALAPGGVLVYSTCTYNHTENEAQVEWLQQHFDLEKYDLIVPPEWGIVTTENGYRFFPHRTRGEGFFLSVLRKKPGVPTRHSPPAGFKSLKNLPKNLTPAMAAWLDNTDRFRFFQTPGGEVLALPASLEQAYLVLDKLLKNKWFGLPAGQFKGADFIPSHGLALSVARASHLPGLSLSREDALLFLKKETFTLPDGSPKGWALATFEDLPLGWVKVLPGRLNNYLPVERRIRMDVRES